MLIDTHAHLDFPDYKNDRAEVIERARNNGVDIIINVGSSLEGSFASVDLSNRYDCIYAACGIHPHDAQKVLKEDIEKIRELIENNNKVVAIGEVGLDFYRNLSPKEVQYNILLDFLKLSNHFDLPLIIHCRDSSPDNKDALRTLLDALKQKKDQPVKGVIHCFSFDRYVLDECLKMGLYISFTANITYKRADNLREVLKYAPLNRLLLETDAPFLAHQAKRGQRNEPSYLSYLVSTISECKGIGSKEIEDATTENARRLFRFNTGCTSH